MSLEEDKQSLIDLFNTARLRAEQGLASVQNGDMDKAKVRIQQFNDTFIAVNIKLGIVQDAMAVQATAEATKDDLKA